MEEYLDSIASDVAKIRSGLSLTAIVLIIIGGTWFFGGDHTKVTIYSRSCNQQIVSAQDCRSWNLAESTYYTNKYTQQVMFDGTYGPVPFEHCTVVDNKDWSCEFSDDSVIAIQNGIFTDTTLNSALYTTQYFGFFTYWWYKLGAFL